MPDMVKVKILKITQVYWGGAQPFFAAGEEAWFSEVVAASLAKQGFVRRLNSDGFVPFKGRFQAMLSTELD
jgi:hypothetical protein